MLPVRRKIKKATKYTSRTRLSKPAAIAIVVVVVVVLILAIVVSIIVQRRRKAKKHNSMVPGYSTDNNGGLYGGTPGYYPGGNGQQQPHGVAAQGMQSTNGAGYQGQGEAAQYYAESAQAQGYYGGVSNGAPQRPPRALNAFPDRV